METKSYRNFSQIISMQSAFEKDGRKLSPDDLSKIEKGSVVFSPEEILWVGEDSEMPEIYQEIKSIDCTGKILLPELVDSHTHLVFGGDRSSEYTMRLNGADYEEIANAGGGILSTMRGTNEMSRDLLFESGKMRIETIQSYGVGTIEVKSGYGLNFDKEYEISLVIHDLKEHFKGKVQIKNTYLAAHAVPKNYSSSSDYMNDVVIPLLKKLAPLNIVDAVDIFHEKNYFDTQDVELLFKTAQDLGIDRKSHADEFYDNKGAILAAQYGCLSTDHLLMTGVDGIKQLAASKTVATFLPGTGFFLGKKQLNARAFLDAGVKVAIASDYNPGSCHCDNLLLVLSLAAPQYKMNIAELYAAVTLNAAHALGIKSQGAIIKGMSPRFSIFDTDKIDNLTYYWGKNFSSKSF